MNTDLWLVLGFGTFVYVGLWAIGRWVLPRFHIPDGALESRNVELQKQLMKIEAQLEDTKRRLTESERKNADLEKTQDFLIKQLESANAKMSKQGEEIVQLNGKVKELERVNVVRVDTTPSKPTGRVLGVWPTPLPLDVAGEKDAIYSTGLEYEALEGEAASRMGIVEQLSQRQYSIVEIGAKGAAQGIQLADGIATPLWWLQLARQHSIDVFVVLANESSKPGVVNVADALFNAGAKAVISVDSSITDIDAVKFARVFYRRLARGIGLAEAVGYAKLVISDAGADAIKLRER